MERVLGHGGGKAVNDSGGQKYVQVVRRGAGGDRMLDLLGDPTPSVGVVNRTPGSSMVHSRAT